MLIILTHIFCKLLYFFRWYETHDRLQKLNQQATLEANEGREEYIKDQIISFGKVFKQYLLIIFRKCLNYFIVNTLYL